MIYKYKGYDIKPHKEFPTSYIIVTEGKGGKIPRVMEGLFTSTAVAKQQIDKYAEAKGIVSAQAVS
jgi:hypothetical protein